MVSLQLRNIFLRLNMEQVQMIADGLPKVKEEVEASSLPLFIEEYNDIKQQLSTQGIHMMEVDHLEPVDDEDFKEVERITKSLFSIANDLDDTKRGEIISELIKLQKVLFG